MMPTPRPSITLVYLMYNEAPNIAAALREGVAYARAAHDVWEIVVVDDGSTDEGAAIVEALAADEPKIRLVQHPRNLGMGAGMRTGIAAASMEYFCFLPSDLQVEAIELAKMVPHLERAPIVLTVYERRADTWVRRGMSRGFRVFLMAAAGMRFSLEGLYLFPTELGAEIAPCVGASSFFFSFELIQRALERGVAVANETIVCKPRVAGHSKVANPRRVARIVGEVMAYRRRRRAERRGEA